MYRRIIKAGRASGVFLFAVAAVIAAIMTGCGGWLTAEEPVSVSQSMPVSQQIAQPPVSVAEDLYTLEIMESVEEDDAIVVSTTYGTFRYPFAFSDLIHIEVENESNHASLKFFAIIGDVYVPVYTIVFNGQEGIFLGFLSIPDSETPVPVYAVIHTLSAELAEELFGTFYAVQETFNDVVASLEENAGFSPGEQK